MAGAPGAERLVTSPEAQAPTSADVWDMRSGRRLFTVRPPGLYSWWSVVAARNLLLFTNWSRTPDVRAYSLHDGSPVALTTDADDVRAAAADAWHEMVERADDGRAVGAEAWHSRRELLGVCPRGLCVVSLDYGERMFWWKGRTVAVLSHNTHNAHVPFNVVIRTTGSLEDVCCHSDAVFIATASHTHVNVYAVHLTDPSLAQRLLLTVARGNGLLCRFVHPTGRDTTAAPMIELGRTVYHRPAVPAMFSCVTPQV